MSDIVSFQNCDILSGQTVVFRNFSWILAPGQAWWVTGPNGSGKSALASALRGDLDLSGQHSIPAPGRVSAVSFETLRELIFRERYFDESDFVEGGVDQGTTARAYIMGKDPSGLTGRFAPKQTGDPSGFAEPINYASPGQTHAGHSADLERLTARMGIGGVLDRGIKFLSTGEIRKVMMCRALLSQPELLILDEPFAGLDSATRVFVAELLAELDAGPNAPAVIVLSDRADDIPAHISHVLALDELRVVFAGPRSGFAAFVRTNPVFAGIAGFRGGDNESAAAPVEEIVGAAKHGEDMDDAAPLLVLNDVTVSYSGRKILDGFSWTLFKGQHTLVRGPNGCGKSTLLNIVTGDNPQVYANDVTVLGYKRGSGESIWDVKAVLGYVSYQFHIDYMYRCDSNLEEVIVSGFYDSIGLYTTPGWSETKAARDWLGVMGLSAKAGQAFQSLSYGEQRAALIARAMVKLPRLLILDECCHGLDPVHREQVLAIVDYIGLNTATTVVYVTHAPDEYLTCTRSVLEFVPDAVPGTELRYNPVFSVQ